ncbi:uncharacterized protein C9orf40 homolog [Hemicordylus capensis]|uniref:uncharacterized protein C9orf40 homolog n=1 Tax=Hemicordylus capensis TaxID=884348 RepID=UPI0023041FC1|nr:uncharacterized protein C9orf40 homolog [Hemicordylus capensis]
MRSSVRSSWSCAAKPGFMAKRGAEALACRAPWENFLSHPPVAKRVRSDSERREPRCATLWSAGGCKKRKRAGEEQEEEAEESTVGKRPAALEASGFCKEPGLAAALQRTTQQQHTLPPEGDVEGAEMASGGDTAGRRSPKLSEKDEDVWCYNSFQYWRSPLPTIDLSDILDLEKDDTKEARDSSSVGLSEMET